MNSVQKSNFRPDKPKLTFLIFGSLSDFFPKFVFFWVEWVEYELVRWNGRKKVQLKKKIDEFCPKN